MIPPTNILDHLIHLSPPNTVHEVSAQFQQLGFKVIQGGTHTGGLTANALVILSDSVYLELISFTHPASYYPLDSPERIAREAHLWASKPCGWIDYCFLGSDSLAPGECVSDVINTRAQQRLYAPEETGGRIRPDGQVVKWVLSRLTEEYSHARGTLPFFCGDVTPRDLRVPPDPADSIHPSTAYGIAQIRVIVNQQNFDETVRDLTAVVATAPSSTSSGNVAWKIETGNHNHPSLVLSIPTNDEEERFMTNHKMGIYEVAIRVKGGKSGPEQTPYGRIYWIPDQQ